MIYNIKIKLEVLAEVKSILLHKLSNFNVKIGQNIQ